MRAGFSAGTSVSLRSHVGQIAVTQLRCDVSVSRVARAVRPQCSIRVTVAGMIALTLLQGAPSASGQMWQVRGHVLDADTKRSVSAAWVELAGSGRRWGVDAGGRFKTELAAGEHRLFVSGLGYRAAVFRVSVHADTALTFELEVEPVPLGAIRVDIPQVVDQLNRRTRALPWSVRVIERGDLDSPTAPTPVDLLKQRRLQMIPCSSGRECIRYRGGLTEPVVCIDDRAADGGLADLRAYPSATLYRIEIHDSGRMIRAYTLWYFELVRQGRIALPAVLRTDRPRC